MRKLSGKSLVMRTFVVAGLVAGALALLIPGFRSVRHEHQVEVLLLEVQRALQDWHVAEEVYPRQTPMSGGELIGLLIESGHLKEPPHNPWTGHPYSPGSELASPDRLRYSTDELAETYALKALERDGEDVFLQIDSTEHQSLE